MSSLFSGMLRLNIVRVIYSAVFYLLLPLIFGRLLWRSIKAPEYRNRYWERLGLYRRRFEGPFIWFHAVSVGEVEAAFPLIKRLQQDYPAKKILITTTTPTGSARVQAVLADSVTHVYLPYDTPGSVARFIAAFKPELGVVMETEIWPNLFAACAAKDIPLCIVNARLSDRSARGYAKIPSLIKPALACVSQIAAQTQEDAERFVSIGAELERVQAVGNLKFDIDIDPQFLDRGKQLKQEYFAGRFVWIIASTHKNEEAIFLSLYPKLKASIPELLLLLVPRHPERFSEVERLVAGNDLKPISRSSGLKCADETDVFLLDSMGELKLFYAAADLAFVGGSMVPVGGHNILEPAALGVPVMFGPYMDNFREIQSNVLAAEAAVQCYNEAEILFNVGNIYQNRAARDALAQKGLQFVADNRGALEKVVALIGSLSGCNRGER